MTSEDQQVVVAVMTGLDSYQSALLNGMRTVLDEHGVALVAHVSDSGATAVQPTLVCLLSRPSTCAVISTNSISAIQESLLSKLIAAQDLPMVRIGQDVADQVCVGADNVQGMTALMHHVLDDCAARSVVLVQGLAHHPDHNVREAVFRSEIARRGLRVDEDLIFRGRSDRVVTKDGIRALLDRRRDMDAVVTMDDWCAVAAVEALSEAGLRVPQDVVVTGYDNYPVATLTWPSLTTVDQHLPDQGATAARIILERLAGAPVTDEHVLTPSHVIMRGSTATGHASSDGPDSTERLAKSVQLHLTTQGELLRLSKALMLSRTLEDIRDALAGSLVGLGISRAFLVIHERADETPNDHAGDHYLSRLLLDYRDGSQPVQPGTFSSCDLLPQDLRHELHQGFLGFLPLLGTQGPLGYLLFEQAFGPVPTSESLNMGLSRTIEAVISTRDLAAYSANLEQLVAGRTHELESEITFRRQVEQDLRIANGKLEQSLALDGLTGLANRTALERHFAEHWGKHVTEQRELAVLMVDVDVFKPYNDLYGHLVGDTALRVVASCLNRSLRYPDDLACRFGGEEFMVVLPYTGEHDALIVATRFAHLLADAAIPHADSPIAPNVTASIGIAVIVPTADSNPETIIAAADAALYRAKRDGRNRIAISTSADTATATH